MNNTTRRVFFIQVASGATALAATHAMAQATAPMVDEKDPAAAGLGYAAGHHQRAAAFCGRPRCGAGGDRATRPTRAADAAASLVHELSGCR